jgi:hypothetical protein
MPTARSLIAGLALALSAISCSDKGPTEANNVDSKADNQAPAAAQAARGPLVIPVNPAQTFTSALGSATINTITITQFTRNATTGVISAVGTLAGTFTATGTTTAVPFTQAFTAPITSLQQQGQRCQILFLDLGPLFLNVLGVEINLSEVVLDITAVAGPGNLLGNLLCALVHLLDQNPLAAGIQTLLNQINALLAGV